MKNIVKICECGAPVETRSNGFEYDQCYECWWKKDPRNQKKEDNHETVWVCKECGLRHYLAEFESPDCCEPGDAKFLNSAEKYLLSRGFLHRSAGWPSAEKAYIAGAKAHQFDHPAVIALVDSCKHMIDTWTPFLEALSEFEKARKAGGGK